MLEKRQKIFLRGRGGGERGKLDNLIVSRKLHTEKMFVFFYLKFVYWRRKLGKQQMGGEKGGTFFSGLKGQ